MDFKAAKRMEAFSQYAVAAAKEAFAQSGISMEDEDPYRVGVIVGSGVGTRYLRVRLLSGSTPSCWTRDPQR